MSIFKAYDIRGVYPKELNEEIAYSIGKAFADFMNVSEIAKPISEHAQKPTVFDIKKILIGRDMRLSSDSLFRSLSQGIIEQGCDVINIGLCSTPMCYFACNFLKADASIMITASHNPKEYNGFKFTRKQAIPISADTGIKEIEKLFEKNKFKKAIKKGEMTRKEIMNDYVKHVLKFIKNKNAKLKVVIDCGNGIGGIETREVFKHLKCKITEMYFEPDGNFPHHEANPLKEENVKELRNKVIQEKADLGIAIDGDADRVFFISNTGEIIPSDFITCLIAKTYLKEKPGETILYDLRSSWITKETIKDNNGNPIMSKVGHSFIKEQLRKTNAIFGGELSGHFYFRDNFYSDSGIIAILKIIDLIATEKKKISELIEPLKKYFASGEINLEVKDKDAKIKELGKKYKKGKISWLDGVRVEFEDWWFNVRPSNTEALLRLNLEAKSKKLMEEKRDEILNIIKN